MAPLSEKTFLVVLVRRKVSTDRNPEGRVVQPVDSVPACSYMPTSECHYVYADEIRKLAAHGIYRTTMTMCIPILLRAARSKNCTVDTTYLAESFGSVFKDGRTRSASRRT